MKFSFASVTFLTLFSIAAVSLGAPTYYDEIGVEVRSPPISGTDLLEARGGAAIIEVASSVIEVAKMVNDIVGNIKQAIAQDKQNRSDLTQKLVGDMKAKDPSFNYMTCHTEHKTAFDGAEGKDWGHSHVEFDVKVGGTIGYEIYFFKSGTFTRIGDGGFLNWAYVGNVKNTSADGKVLTFAPP